MRILSFVPLRVLFKLGVPIKGVGDLGDRALRDASPRDIFDGKHHPFQAFAR